MFDHAQAPRLGQPTPVENAGVQLVTIETLPEIAYRGQIVYLLDQDKFRIYDGVAWQNPTSEANAGSQTFVGSSAPVADAIGDLWMNNSTYQLNVWDGVQWRPMIDPAAAAAATAASAAAANADAALGLANAAQATADGKITTYYTAVQPAAPTFSPRAGDLWINTATNQLYRFSNATTVVSVQDAKIVAALNAAGTAQATADLKIQTYYVANPPTGLGAVDIGDLWFDTDDGNKPYRWNGTAWVSIQDAAISAASSAAATATESALAALTAAQAAQAAADGSITSYYQATQPWANGASGHTSDLGDLWYNTSNNQSYRWDGTTWTLIQDNGISVALAAAQNAQTTADGKITAFYQTGPPTMAGLGDLWFDTDDQNKPYFCSNNTSTPIVWTLVRDQSIAVAQSTADSKAKVFTQPIAPTGLGPIDINDVWYDSSNGNKRYTWDGTLWTGSPIGSGAISDAAIQENHLLDGAVTFAKMRVGDFSNVVMNPGFEDSTTSAAPHSTVSAASLVPSPTSPRSGAQCGLLTIAADVATTTDLVSINGLPTSTSAHPKVSLGDTYRISAWVKLLSGSATLRFVIRTRNATATANVEQVGGTAVGLTVGVWTQISFDYTIADPNSAFAFWRINTTSATAGTTIAIDDMFARRKLTGELLVDGTITGDKIAADAITGKTVTGGIVRTAAAGNRVEILNATGSTGEIDFYSGDAGEVAKGSMVAGTVTAGQIGKVTIASPSYGSTASNIEVQSGAKNGSAGSFIRLRADQTQLLAPSILVDGKLSPGQNGWDNGGFTYPSGWAGGLVFWQIFGGCFLTVGFTYTSGFDTIGPHRSIDTSVTAAGNVNDQIWSGLPTAYCPSANTYFSIKWGGYMATACLTTAGELRITAAEGTGSTRTIQNGEGAIGGSAAIYVGAGLPTRPIR